MRHLGRHWLVWAATALSGVLVHYMFSRILGMPVATLITLALLVTWLVPRPWRILIPLSVIAELIAITPPFAMTGAVWAPLLIFWLRGRIQADISFSYVVLLAVSAALSLIIAVGITVYPAWLTIPWAAVLVTWFAITGIAAVASLLLISLQGRYLHGRYF